MGRPCVQQPVSNTERLSMNDAQIIEVVQETLLLMIQLGLPPMIVGLIVGVIIALFQALTQIQEITLVFVPKIVSVFLTIYLFFPSMMKILEIFTQGLADRIIGIQ